MYDTTVTIQRPANTTYVSPLDGRAATGIPVQVDQASDKEVVEHSQIYQWYGKLLYKIKVNWQPNALVRQDDVLVDERFIDPDIAGGATYFHYHVVGRPRNYFLDHQECYCDATVGT